MRHQPAQTRPANRGTVDEPTPGVSMQRLEYKLLLSFGQVVQIVATHEMRLRHVVAQDLSFCRRYLQFLVPIRQRQPFHQPLIAARGIAERIRRDIDVACLIGHPQGGEILRLPEEIGRAVDDESHRLSFEQQPASIPARLFGTSGFGAPAALAQQIAEQFELSAKFAMLQRFGIVENETHTPRTFAKECSGLARHEVSDALFEHGQMDRRRYLLLPLESCCLVVQRIDDRGKYEARPVVVELDEVPPVPWGKMKIPSTEEANLRPPELHDRRRLAQGCRLPGPARRHTVKDANEIRYLVEHCAGDNLMSRHDTQFCRYLRHPAGLHFPVAVLRIPRLEPPTILAAFVAASRALSCQLERPALFLEGRNTADHRR